MNQKLSLEDYVSRFDRLAVYRVVYYIKEKFNSDVEAFWNARRELKTFKTKSTKEKNASYKEVFRNMNTFNFTGISKRYQYMILDGIVRSHQLMEQFRTRLSELGYTIQKHGTLFYKDEPHHFSNIYLPPKSKIKSIFADKTKLDEVLEFDSYNRAEQKVLYMWSKEHLPEEQRMKLEQDEHLRKKYGWTQVQIDSLRANNLLESQIKTEEERRARGRRRTQKSMENEIKELKAQVEALKSGAKVQEPVQEPAEVQTEPAEVKNPIQSKLNQPWHPEDDIPEVDAYSREGKKEEPVQETAKNTTEEPAPASVPENDIPAPPSPPDEIPEDDPCFFDSWNDLVENGIKRTLAKGVCRPSTIMEWVQDIIPDWEYKRTITDSWWASLNTLQWREKFYVDCWVQKEPPEEQLRITHCKVWLLRRLGRQLYGCHAKKLFRSIKVNGEWAPISDARVQAAKRRIAAEFQKVADCQRQIIREPELQKLDSGSNIASL